MYDLFLSKLKRVKDIMQLKHPDRMLTCCATQACAYLLSAAATVLHPAAAAPAPSYASDLSPLVATADAAGPALATADAAGPALATADAAGPALATADAAGPALATADAAGPALATADAAGPALATADAAGHALATAAAAVDTSAACVDVAAPATVDAALTNKPDDVLPICQPAEVRSNTVLAAEQVCLTLTASCSQCSYIAGLLSPAFAPTPLTFTSTKWLCIALCTVYCCISAACFYARLDLSWLSLCSSLVVRSLSPGCVRLTSLRSSPQLWLVPSQGADMAAGTSQTRHACRYRPLHFTLHLCVTLSCLPQSVFCLMLLLVVCSCCSRHV